MTSTADPSDVRRRWERSIANAPAGQIDHGWLRLLDLADRRPGDGLTEWNAALGGEPPDPPLDNGLMVAFDAVGGFFVLPVRTDAGMRYLGPDGTGWTNLGLAAEMFVTWCMSDRLAQFYADARWPGWEEEVAALGSGQAFLIYPPLGFDGPPLKDRARRAVPARELWTFAHSLAAAPDAFRLAASGAPSSRDIRAR